MNRILFAIVVFFLPLTGCGDRHQPEVRRGGGETRESAGKEPSLNESSSPRSENPHGNLLENPHGQTASEQPAETLGPVVDLGSLTLTAPQGWIRKPPRNSILLAEFSLPQAKGDPSDGRLTVSEVRGGIQANIDRWKGQFSGTPKTSEEHLKAAGKDVTLVDFTGTYQDQQGMMGPVTEKPDYRLLGAILATGEQGNVFVKAYGPVKTMAAQAAAFRKFVESLKAK